MLGFVSVMCFVLFSFRLLVFCGSVLWLVWCILVANLSYRMSLLTGAFGCFSPLCWSSACLVVLLSDSLLCLFLLLVSA